MSDIPASMTTLLQRTEKALILCNFVAALTLFAVDGFDFFTFTGEFPYPEWYGLMLFSGITAFSMVKVMVMFAPTKAREIGSFYYQIVYALLTVEVLATVMFVFKTLIEKQA